MSKVEFVKCTKQEVGNGAREKVVCLVFVADDDAWTVFSAEILKADMGNGTFHPEKAKLAILDWLRAASVEMKDREILVPVTHVSQAAFDKIKGRAG